MKEEEIPTLEEQTQSVINGVKENRLFLKSHNLDYKIILSVNSPLFAKLKENMPEELSDLEILEDKNLLPGRVAGEIKIDEGKKNDG